MPKISALGGMSSRGFGEFAQQTAANYIEDVFSTYLYTGNGSTQTITNGIDLSGKGGLVWTKCRSTTYNHQLYDTVRGATKSIFSNLTDAQLTLSTGLTAFNASGYTLGANGAVNDSVATYASWTFRKQPKFFDVVTYTGNGTTGRVINHNLGSSPGMIVFKNYSGVSQWPTWHRSLAANNILFLNTNAASASSSGYVSAVSSTTFIINANVNTNGATFVAYLFAHDAGGFGADGSQNAISCGSFTTDASGNATVNLGYEPQYVLYKVTSTTGGWNVTDSMRGMPVGGNTATLAPNDANAEYAVSNDISPTATGFNVTISGAASRTYIYMAIRRGPMRTPTDATKVFTPTSASSSGPFTATAGFPVDFVAYGAKSSTDKWFDFDRLRGNPYLQSNTTAAEVSSVGAFDSNTAFYLSGTSGNYSAYINHLFRRAPSFMDVVCYTGTGSATTVSHNLGVVPELMIIKPRTGSLGWTVYSASISNTEYLMFNTTAAKATGTTRWNSTTPTSTVFTVGTNIGVNNSGIPFVAYLFSTCPGVSKVGSYTGTGATQTISCGFTGGARYVLIKRTDSTGDWWVWDTARGMISGTDPRLAYNSTAAETNANWVYTTTGGFQIVTSDATVNASGGTYIFLAIA